MKPAKILLLTFTLITVTGLSSCVTMKTYRTTKAESLRSGQSYRDLMDENQQLREQRESLEAQYAALLAQRSNDGRNYAELEKLLNERTNALAEIRELLSEALQDFNSQGLTVTERDGTIYVSMEEKLLFELGKAEVSPEGEKAIRQVAGVLARNPNIQITVEGHTDNLPYRNRAESEIKDNWDLSVHRATAVIRILTDGSNINPRRITAAGRSQYIPVVANTSPENRQQNRRTEIILTPDMDRLMELLSEASRIIEK